jgi:hypothetical protein
MPGVVKALFQHGPLLGTALLPRAEWAAVWDCLGSFLLGELTSYCTDDGEERKNPSPPHPTTRARARVCVCTLGEKGEENAKFGVGERKRTLLDKSDVH